MVRIKPFAAIRPPKELVEEVAARPYDVLNSAEAKAEAGEKSLLHITKPEIDFDPIIDEHSSQAYDKAVENFRAETPIPHGCDDIPTIAFLGGKSHNQLIEAERRGTEYALLRAGRMSQTITLPAVNAETVGQLLYFFELVTAYTGAMLEIDAFNQPGVEESKIAAYAVMGYDSEIHTAKREEMRACPEGKPEYVF